MRTAEPISRGGLSSGPSALTVRGSLDRGPGCLRACGWAMWGGGGASQVGLHSGRHPGEGFRSPAAQGTCVGGGAGRADLTELPVSLVSSFLSSFRRP